MKGGERSIFEGSVGVAILFLISIGLGFQIGSQLF